MNEQELRIKIYEYLGLELGSLPSESGNDWQRAEKEVLEDYKQKELEKVKNIKITDYLTIDKQTDEFKTVLKTTFVGMQNLKHLIAERNDLENNEIKQLILTGDKDVLIRLSKSQKLTPEQIDLIIPKSVYLVKKNLITNQNLTDEQKSQLLALMNDSSLDYSELLKLINFTTI